VKTLVDLCSGCGGFSFGFIDPGIKFIAVDNWNIALESYKANIPNCEIINVKVEDLDISVLGKVNYLIFSPPCQNHSRSNPRRDLDTSIIETCLKIKDLLKPDIWIIEEVTEVEKYFEDPKHVLYNAIPKEYITRYKATDVGLPDRRERMFAGNFPRFFPAPFKQIIVNGHAWKKTVKTPIAHMRGIGHGKQDYRKTREEYRGLARFLVDVGVLKAMPKNPFDTDVMKWLLGFPLDYKLAGDRLEQQQQIGNAVSPAISRRIYDEIKKGRKFEMIQKLILQNV